MDSDNWRVKRVCSEKQQNSPFPQRNQGSPFSKREHSDEKPEYSQRELFGRPFNSPFNTKGRGGGSVKEQGSPSHFYGPVSDQHRKPVKDTHVSEECSTGRQVLTRV